MKIRHTLLPLLILALSALLLSTRSAASTTTALFIENTGQYPDEVRYLAFAGSETLWLTNDTLWIIARDQTWQLTLPGAPPHLTASQPRPTTVSYYRTSDPANWHERVPVWGRVQYTSPDFDLELTGSHAGFILRLTGAESIGIQMIPEQGEPSTFTLQPGQATALHALLSPAHAGTPTPDHPASPHGGQLLFGSYLGSNGLDEAQAIATDDLGRIYLAGQMLPVLPPLAPEQPQHAVEAFIARFNPDGTDLEYLTIILGDVEDWGKGVAVSNTYEAYFAGETDSTDFPTTPGAYDTDENGSFDAFLMKLGADGLMAYSTLLGEAEWDTATAVAVDDAGHAYLTGDTWSPNFPTTSDAFDNEHTGPRDVFIAKFNPDGSQLLYSTFIGGDNIERAEAIALSGTGVLITGWTSSTNFPTSPNGYDTTYNGGVDAFALRLTPGASALTFGTFLGGSGTDRGRALAVDSTGRVFIGGETASNNFPATGGAYDTTYGGGLCDFLPCPDGFAARLSANGTALDYATYLGGAAWDQTNDLAVDPDGNVYLTGYTESSLFPTSPNAYDDTLSGNRDGFISVLNGSFNSLLYSTFLGGSNGDSANALSLGSNGGTFVGGATNSGDFPTTAGAYDTTPNGDYDGFAVLLSLSLNPFVTPTPTITPTGTLPTPTPSRTPTITPSPTMTPTPTHTPPPPPATHDIFLPIIHHAP